jgi:predicted ATP-dependent endonuclease of OLD family
MINDLTIGYYRAYGASQTFEFARCGEDQLGLTLLVGQNNAGKSTPLNLLREIFSQESDIVFDLQSRHYEGHPPELRLGMHRDGESITINCVQQDKAFYRKAVDDLPPSQSDAKRNSLRRHIKYIPSRRSWSDRFQRGARQNISQLEEQLYRVIRGQEAQLGSLLAQVIRDEKKADFDAILRQVLPDMVGWSIDSIMDQDCIVYETHSGKIHAIGLLGDGFSSVFRLAYTLFSSAPGDTILLDEPELSLHPEAQRSLYRLIRQLSKDRQIILATHSPYMVNWPDLAAGAKLYRLSLDAAGCTQIKSISPQVLSSIMSVAHKDIRNRKLFDILAKEVFFRPSVVFCEGQEDVHYIENYLEERDHAPLPLFGYGSGGASFIEPWLDLASELGVRAAALYDKNQQEEADRVREKFADDPNVLIRVLPRDDIRTKDDVGIVGIFDSKGTIDLMVKDDFDALLDDIYKHVVAH